MARFIDLSHVFEDGMPGIRMRAADGSEVRLTARIRTLVTHEQSRPNYQGKAEFALTEVSFQTSIGTYLDAPYVRYPHGRDIGALRVEELVLPGLLIDLTHLRAGEMAGIEDLRKGAAGGSHGELDVAGKAVLCRFGWDRHWGSEAYHTYPFLSRAAIRVLAEGGARLVGVDTINIDDGADPERPAHSRFLEHDIFIVENLCNLGALQEAAANRPFRFFALPIRAKGAGSMPVRAFAEMMD
jgi:kynurenine formamidase